MTGWLWLGDRRLLSALYSRPFQFTQSPIQYPTSYEDPNTGVYHAQLTGDQKGNLQHLFNREDEPMVLIGSYVITSCGLNLQHRCHHVAFLDPPPSKATGEQAVARVHRVGQAEIVDAITFSTNKTFNDRQFLNNIRKAMPGLLASLNKRLFGRNITSAAFEDEEFVPDVGEWVKWQGVIIRH
ncbi:hypothetical protein PV08_07439 [Exophiala spinifera]|uniref:Helicase C-terminal domain-containing protein n=1 Tax=Exophiala spinifera TaxID=91928 RepID=A0A0D2B7J7_9EURO|nr:uncharacterized protein PV08_07439 [Exophiala spinifera]KIW14655.1 hypothetical protein PV08_07439 [Exophiala spinifera]